MQNKPSRFAIIPTLLLVFLTSAFGQDSATTKALHDLFDREWEYQLQQNPTRASSLGDRRWNDRWGDASLEGIKRRHEHNLVVLAELAKIDRSKLSARDQLNYDLFKQDYETNVEGYKYRWYLIPLNQRGGIQSQDELASSLRFETVKDYEDWIARMKALPTLMDQTIGVMREGIKARMVLPRVIMQRIPAQIDKQIVSNPDQSLFYKPFKRFPASMPTSEKERLMREGIAAVNAHIVPSYQRFKQFFVTEYLPATYDEVGVWQAPQGEELYAFLVRRFTTTKMTPREVHERGQSEVRRIRAQMQEVMDQVGFKGTLQ